MNSFMEYEHCSVRYSSVEQNSCKLREKGLNHDVFWMTCDKAEHK